MSDDILSRERIAEIDCLKERAKFSPLSTREPELSKAIADMLKHSDALLGIIRVQLESSGDCRCMGCQRGREALTKTGRLP